MFCSLCWINLLICSFLLLPFTHSSSVIEPQLIDKTKENNGIENANPAKSDKEEKPTILKLDVNDPSSVSSNITTTSNNATLPGNKIISILPSQMQSDNGALQRLFLVLLGISTLSILYVAYRFYSTRKGGIRPTAVRKYGVLTQRTDIEMLPLPLDDEEDDDTVFDVGNHVNTR